MPVRVLVVDDFPRMADLLAREIQGKGYSVRVAYDGAAALQVAVEFEPHALVSDVFMPGLNGFELAKAVTARLPKCGVLLMSVDEATWRGQHDHLAYKVVRKSNALDEIFEFLARVEKKA